MIDYDNLDGLTVLEYAVRDAIDSGRSVNMACRTIGTTPATFTRIHKQLVKAGRLKEETLRNKEENSSFAEKSIHRQCMDEYFEFVNVRIGVAPKINGAEGKALKDIIKYLEGAIRAKKGGVGEVTNEDILISWQYILNNWNRLGDFYSRRIKLANISSDIVNILVEVKNGRTTKDTRTGRSSLAAQLRS